jgi:hypothetical protein
MAFAAIGASAAQDLATNPGTGARKGGLAGLLSFGDTSSTSQFGAFRPGGALAPPRPTDLIGAFQGKNTGSVAAAALAPGIGQKIAALFTGPGRGQIRRDAARSEAMQSPGLLSILGAVRASGATTADQIAAVVGTVVRTNPTASSALGAVLSNAARYGGFTSAQGEAANALGDVLKFTFGLGTVRTKGAPSAEDVVRALGGGATPVPLATPTTVTGAPVPVPPGVPPTATLTSGTPLAQLQNLQAFMAGTAPASTPQGVSNMGTWLDAVTAGVQALPSVLSQFSGVVPSSAGSPFVLPGGAPITNALFNNLDMTPGFNIGPQGSGILTDPFRLTANGARAQIHYAMNPSSGKAELFGPLGRPVLFSRDLAVCRRVRKISGRFGSAVGMHRTRARSRRGGR